ncbi:methyltransferase domain-containing protein [Occallatibacter savannae]|uniref:methyltransferase domain-containing protein n=1 Tax=Occallatibacter savannae TaxID=1002691 RepID=UPI000D688650|nr:methyltransferase domain-containing protein [Occallatibacter savannae]
MPPEAPDLSRRADLAEFPELMDEPCSREEMRACLKDLARVNRWFLAYRPTLKWLDSLELRSSGRAVHILDVGCGYGDSLRRIERWAQQRNLEVALTGCDLNPDTIAIAREASPARSRIRWIASDVFALKFDRPVDIIVSSLFTHHLEEDEIVRFLGWMERTARTGWFINDLSRASVPYGLFKAFARVAHLHRFVQHDGPVSIARAFVEDDWRRMCSAAGLGAGDVRIEGFVPARLCVGRTKPAVRR